MVVRTDKVTLGEFCVEDLVGCGSHLAHIEALVLSVVKVKHAHRV
jgi:hypothetical protein